MKKQRLDSLGEISRVVARSQQQIHPPTTVPLEKGDLPFFASILDEFARSEWSAHQLELAAMLARTMADLEREQRELRVEGGVSKSDKGTPVVNPRKVLVQMSAGMILSFRRSLQLHARAQTRDLEDAGVRRKLAKDAEARVDIQHDNLLG